MVFFLLSMTVNANVIDKNLARQIEPIIHDWLTYYKIDIYQFECANDSQPCLSTIKTGIEHYQPKLKDTQSIYHKKFDLIRDDIYDPILHEYSPNQLYYIALLTSIGVYKTDKSEYEYLGGDDSQSIYLYDRLKHRVDLVLWLGISQMAEAVFWEKHNRFFVITGFGVFNYDKQYEDEGLFIVINGDKYVLKHTIDKNPYYYETLQKRHINSID